jgi:hypothetical protein
LILLIPAGPVTNGEPFSTEGLHADKSSTAITIVFLISSPFISIAGFVILLSGDSALSPMPALPYLFDVTRVPP